MKKSLFLLLIMFILFGGILTVNADTAACPNDPNYSSLQSSYGNPRKELIPLEEKDNNGNYKKLIEVFGKATCTVSNRSCNYNYFNVGTNVEDYLKDNVVCADGSRYIQYELITDGSSNEFKVSGKYNRTEDYECYFREEYVVVCLSDNNSSSSENVIQLPSSGDNGGSSSQYPGSSTVPNEDTGVFTYYIVLIVIAFVSYIVLMLSKKYNLFKKI